MKNKYLQRFVALTMAASMVLTSAPVSAADEVILMEAAQEVSTDAPAVSEEAPATQESLAVEEAGVAEAATGENAPEAGSAEDELVLDAEIVATPETQAQEQIAEEDVIHVAPILDESVETPESTQPDTPDPAKVPTKVTNLRFDEEYPDDICWDWNNLADYYEIRIAINNEEYKNSEGGFVRWWSTYYELENLSATSLYAYVLDKQEKVDGGTKRLSDQKDVTLSISVRAVNEDWSTDDGTPVLYAGEFSDPVSYDFNVTPEKPAKVTNVHLDVDDPDVLRWNPEVRADYYYIRIQDGTYEYRRSGDYEKVRANGRCTYDLSNLAKRADEFYAYDLTTKQAVNNADGSSIRLSDRKDVTALSVAVCAVNEGKTYGGVTAKNEGPWSDAVSYQFKAYEETPEIPQNVRIEDGRIYFDSTSGCSVEMSVLADGKEYVVRAYSLYDETSKQFRDCYDYVSVGSGDDLEDIGSLHFWTKDEAGNWRYDEKDTAFAPGKTYTLKVREYTGDGLKKVTSPWSGEVTYVAVDSAKQKPEKTGNIRYSDGWLYWNAVPGLRDGAYNGVYGYIVTVSGAKDPIKLSGDGYYDEDEDEWISATSLYLESYPTHFKTGSKYTVTIKSYRAISGVYNPETYETKYEYVYSDDSAPFEFTYGEVVESLGKPAATVTEDGLLQWAAVQGASEYDVLIKEGDVVFTELVGKRDESTGKWIQTVDTSKSLTVSGTRTSLVCSTDLDLYHWILVDGVWKKALDADGEFAEPFQRGRTYTLQVRAKNDTKGAGPWSDAVSYTVKTSYLSSAKPATVTGLTVLTSASQKEDNLLLDGATLAWNEMDNVDWYEFLIKDAAGNVYLASKPELKADGSVDVENCYPEDYADVSRYAIRHLSGYRAYVKAAGKALTVAKGADGRELKSMTPGQTYTISLRAVNTYWDATDAIARKVKGDWSSPVTYTVTGAEGIRDLKYVSADEENYYFTYTSSFVNTIYYQVATDNAFTTASVVSGGWVSYSVETGVGTAKLPILKQASYLRPGTTYYVRAVVATSAPTDAELASLNPVVASFTTEARSAKNITGLKLYEDKNPEFTFVFNGTLEEGYDYFELQYAKSNSKNDADWISVGQITTLDLSDLPSGTYYVRARAYIVVDGIKKYGNPTNVLSVSVTTSMTSISGLKLAKKTASGYKFTFTGDVKWNEDVEYQVSESASFETNKSKKTWSNDVFARSENSFTVSYVDLEPGKKYYVRARVIKPSAPADQRYGSYTKSISFTAAMPKTYVSTTVVTDKAVTLTMDSASDFSGWLTGYQVQKKLGKKYLTMAQTTNNVYKNTGLQADTTYLYRVRPYYYSKETKKTTYGAWAYATVTTWGGALNVKATPKSTTSIKITWDKVPGATAYELYRLVGSSDSTQASAGKYDGYSKWELVKTLKKKAKSYTDKKLDKNLAYSYKVKAVKTVDKKTYSIEEQSYRVNLAFPDDMPIVDVITYADGKTKVTWTPIYAGKGYLIEKYDDVNRVWKQHKKITKKSTSSYTFAAVSKETDYRISAMKSETEYTSEEYITIYPALAAPTNVKAKANKDGSITVSWNKVSGADYYLVYRTTSSDAYYEKDAKKYRYDSGALVQAYVADSTTVSGYRVLEDDERTDTKITDRPISYTVNGATNEVYEGPKPGVTYYYFVVACKRGVSYQWKNGETDEGTSYDPGRYGSKSASATVTSTKQPAKPASFKVKAAAKKKQVTLTWKTVKGAIGYEVYRSTKKKSGFEKIAELGKVKKYVDKSVKKDTKYYYKIRAIQTNEAGAYVYSKYTAVKNVKVGAKKTTKKTTSSKSASSKSTSKTASKK